MRLAAVLVSIPLAFGVQHTSTPELESLLRRCGRNVRPIEWQHWQVHSLRCATRCRTVPALLSTFKVPNTAILLESGAASDPDYLVKVRPHAQADEPRLGARPHAPIRVPILGPLVLPDASRAAPGSCLLRPVSSSSSITATRTPAAASTRRANHFGSTGRLSISADEQVEFLRRFYEGRLGLLNRTTRLTKDIMVAEEGSGWRLSAKTGACHPTGENTTNSYVGYVENGEIVSYFALEMSDKDFGLASPNGFRRRARFFLTSVCCRKFIKSRAAITECLGFARCSCRLATTAFAGLLRGRAHALRQSAAARPVGAANISAPEVARSTGFGVSRRRTPVNARPAKPTGSAAQIWWRRNVEHSADAVRLSSFGHTLHVYAACPSVRRAARQYATTTDDVRHPTPRLRAETSPILNDQPLLACRSTPFFWTPGGRLSGRTGNV